MCAWLSHENWTHRRSPGGWRTGADMYVVEAELEFRHVWKLEEYPPHTADAPSTPRDLNQQEFRDVTTLVGPRIDLRHRPTNSAQTPRGIEPVPWDLSAANGI